MSRHRATERRPEPRGRQSARWRWGWLIPVVAMLVAGWYWWNERPAALYQSARKLAETDPAEAETLVVAAIVQSGGSYPEAELFHALLSARRREWTTSLAAFRLIREPQHCSGVELVELTERALAVREFALTQLAAEASWKNATVLADPELLSRLLIVQDAVSPNDVVLESCQTLTRLAPTAWLPWSIRAATENKTGKLAASAKSLCTALELHPPDKEADRLRLDLTDRWLDLGEAALARGELDRLLERGDPSREILLRQAFLCRLEGDTAQARSAADQALLSSPGWSSGLFIRGILRLDAGEAQWAADDLRAMIGQEPFRKEAHHKLGQALLEIGDVENGRRHLAKARELAAATDELLTLTSQVAGPSADPAAAARLIELNRKIGRFDEADRWKRIAAAVAHGK